MSTYALPTTGWVILGTVEKDGVDQFGTVTTFINVASEDAAAEYFEHEVQMLDRCAPKNVVHRRTLVRRTSPDGIGDVTYLKTGPLQGSGKAVW